MKGKAGFMQVFGVNSICMRLVLLIVCSLLLQACATSSTSTQLIPGNELSRQSLGFRESTGIISIKEIDPFNVVVNKSICQNELHSIEYQALLETTHATYLLDCSDAYVDYVAWNLTAVGVPLLLDSVTGFNLFRGICFKKPPLFRIVTAPSNKIIINEVFDRASGLCTDNPVTDVLVTVTINDEKISITSSAEGIVAMPAEKLAEIKKSAEKVQIKYQYDTAELSTVYLKEQAKQKRSRIKGSSEASDENTAGFDSETDPVGVSGKINTTVQSGLQSDGVKKITVNRAAQPESVEKLPAAVLNIASPRFVVRFDLYKAIVKYEYLPGLRLIADELKKNPELVSIIDGHTDYIDTADKNVRMSIRRAAVIRDYFINTFGLLAERFQINGHGLTRPVANNGTAAGRAENRRVEINIVDGN